MTALLAKPLEQVTAADLAAFLAEQRAEGPTLEYKEALPGVQRERPDPWRDKRDVPPAARDALLSEVVAFANAGGGHLVVGVAETKEAPPRPDGVRPVAACADLALRLRHQLRDCVDPPLLADVEGIRVDDDGAGVVVFRVPSSPRAPHRLTTTREVYVRRADRCEVVKSMREIQELTLRRYEAGLRLERRFSERAEMFARNPSGPRTKAHGLQGEIGVRVTLIPLGDELVIPHDRLPARAIYRHVKAIRNGSERLVEVPISPPDARRAILRGVRFDSSAGTLTTRVVELEDGLVEYFLWDGMEARFPGLAADWVLGLAGCAMLAADRARRAAERPTTEYGMEVELRRAWPSGSGLAFRPLGAGGSVLTYNLLDIEGEAVTFPRLAFSTLEEAAAALDVLARDLYNAGGATWEPGSLRVDLTAVDVR